MGIRYLKFRNYLIFLTLACLALLINKLLKPMYASREIAKIMTLETRNARAGKICDDMIYLDDLNGENNAFFTWLTNASTWTSKQTLSVESFLIYHPEFSVTVIAPKLPIDFFNHLVTAGYTVHVLHVTPDILYDNCAFVGPNSAMWLSQHHEHEKGEFFYSHFSDYLRFWLLYKFGGLYMDLDAITLQELPLSMEFIGRDCVEFNHDGTCSLCSNHAVNWCIDDMYYLAPGVMNMFSGHQFLHDIIEGAFTRNYDRECWNCVGPKAITKAWLLTKPPFLTILDSFLLYPYNYKTSKHVFLRSKSALLEANLLQRKSYSLHLFGKVSSENAIEDGSIFSILMEKLRLSSNCSTISVYSPSQMVLSAEIDFKALNVIILRVSTSMKYAGVTRIRVCLTGVIGHFYFSSGKESCQRFENFRLANEHLKSIEYDGTSWNDSLSLSITVNDAHTTVSSISTICWELSVTFISKTVSRHRKVKMLLTSLQKFYPNSPTIISNDGKSELRVSMSQYKRLKIHELTYDVGLSFSRNYMISAAETPYVFLIDDDFFVNDVQFDILLMALINDKADIAGVQIFEDLKSGLDYSGMLEIAYSNYGQFLKFRLGEYEGTGQCRHKDLVPNIFLAKRDSLLRVKWDRSLKLGEHEDFFLRARAGGLKTVSCPGISVHHEQDRWWDRKDGYSMSRRRVYPYMQDMLDKRNLIALNSLGHWIACSSSFSRGDFSIHDMKNLCSELFKNLTHDSLKTLTLETRAHMTQ